MVAEEEEIRGQDGGVTGCILSGEKADELATEVQGLLDVGDLVLNGAEDFVVNTTVKQQLPS